MITVAISVFVKVPIPGHVKTRLIQAFGATMAALLAECFLKDLLSRLCNSELIHSSRLYIHYWPLHEEMRLRQILNEVPLNNTSVVITPQYGSHLGERLEHALQLTRHMNTLLIGTDSPDLPLEEMSRALESTRRGESYIVRVKDGGYALLALPMNSPKGIFEDVLWSSETTCIQQTRRIECLGLTVRQSDTVWSDVDYPDDLLFLYRRLSQSPHIAPRTYQLIKHFYNASI